MSFRSVAAKNVVVRMSGVMAVAGAALFTVSVTNGSFIRAQSPKTAAKPAAPPKVRLPDESAGIDGIARALISAFDQADSVALGEAHGRKLDSDLRIAVVRHPDFAKKVRSIGSGHSEGFDAQLAQLAHPRIPWVETGVR